MADKVKVWYDAPGYEKETKHDAVRERVDAEGRVIGFSIIGVTKFRKSKLLETDLTRDVV